MAPERTNALYPVRIGRNLPALRTANSQGFAAAMHALLAKGTVGGPSAGRVAASMQRTALPASTGAATSRTAYDGIIESTAAREGVDSALVRAVVEAESGFNPNAVSSAGAVGLMQLMPATARGLGVKDSRDPASNIAGGVKFLKSMLEKFNSVPLALAAYNAGPGAVEKYGGVPPYAETESYVDKVLQLHARNRSAGRRPDGGDANGGLTA